MERNTKDPFGIDAYLSQVPRLNFVALENRGKVKLSPKAREKIQVVVDELYTDAVFSTKPTKPAREQLVKFEQAVERAANVAKEVLHSYRQLTPSMQLRMLQVLDNTRRFSRWAEALQKSGKVELHHPMRETKTPPRGRALTALFALSLRPSKSPSFSKRHRSVQRLFLKFLEDNQCDADAFHAFVKRAQSEISGLDHSIRPGRMRSSRDLLRDAIKKLHVVYGRKAKYTYNDINKTFTGPFVEFVTEIVQQLKPYVQEATADLFPSGVFVRILRPTLEVRQTEMNAIGRAIKEALQGQ